MASHSDGVQRNGNVELGWQDEQSGGRSPSGSCPRCIGVPGDRKKQLELAAYTYSKSIDDTSAFEPVGTDQNFPQNSYDYRAERALSSFDMRQRAVVAYVYRLPFHNRWLRNFDNSGIVTAQSGQPFTPMLEFDNSNTGGARNGYDRTDVVGDWHLANPSPQEWFNTAAFAIRRRILSAMPAATSWSAWGCSLWTHLWPAVFR
ncbi:MAG: hypothetical protein ABSH24_03070 [Bryobacteraceae bacterium]|jgi:hypothetical protein